ncbi:MAG: VCBS repeat-containing protein [Pirellulaceae bacterium]|nr:VCBS repeat-containing protein [Pirellulaceae bacterium]
MTRRPRPFHVASRPTRAARRPKGGHGPKSPRSRRPRFECLEDRRLLTVAWRNPVNSLDTSGDGLVAPNDALGLINDLNVLGARPLPAERPADATFLDVTGDQMIAPVDVLVVINALNNGVAVPYRLAEGTRLADEAAITITVGQPSGTRIYSLEVDARFDTSGDSTVSRDQLAIYLVDADSPDMTLLDLGPDGSPLFTLTADGANFIPGLVRWNGSVVEIDLSQVSDRDTASLRLQLLSHDLDGGTQVRVRPLANAVDPDRTPASRLLSDPLSQSPGEALDVDALTENSTINVLLENVRFESGTGDYSAELRLRNTQSNAGRQLAVVLPDLPAGVSVANASGVTANGDAYVSFAPAIAPGGLGQGQYSDRINLRIDNPAGLAFQLTPTVLAGQPNQAPMFDPPADLSTTPGDVLEVSLTASDADGDLVTFSLRPLGPLPTMELNGSGALVVRPAPDEVGTFQFDVAAMDGAAETVRTFNLEVVADPMTTTRVSGLVLDTSRQPIPGIRVNIGDLVTLTGADGSFLLETPGALPSDTMQIHGEDFVDPNPMGQPIVFPFVAEKLELMFGRPEFAGVNNVIARPIYLPPLDVAGGSTIDPGADTLVEQQIAPGEMASVFVAAGTLLDQQSQPFTGVLSITEVPPDLTPAALPDDVFVDAVVTIQPGEMVFTQPAPLTLPNRAGFPAGEQFDLFSINPVTGQFDNVGRGQVTPDGSAIATIEGGVLNSSWHFFSPRLNEVANFNAGGQRNIDNGANNWAAKREATSDVEAHSGALIESHSLVTYESLGQTRQISLWYDSLRADPRHIVHRTISNLQGTLGDQLLMNARVRRGDLNFIVPGFFDPQNTIGISGDFGFHFWQVPLGLNTVDVSLQFDLSAHESGVYNVLTRVGVVRAQGGPGNGRLNVTRTIPVVHVNSVLSPFGAGWGIKGLHQLVPNPDDGSILLVDGDGTELLFSADQIAPPGQPQQFTSPPGEFTRLERLADGTFLRTTKEQTVFAFDAQGRLLSETDRHGNATTYQYDGAGRLTAITDPVGLTTTLTYAGGRLSEVQDPAGRITRLRHVNGDLVGITDPDGTERRFEYDARHHLVAEVDKRGNREEAVYGFHGRVLEAIKKDGTRPRFAPPQTDGLLPVGATTNPDNPPQAAVVVEQAIVTTIDENGRATFAELDQFGQIVREFDEEGPLPSVTRNEQNLPLTVTDGRGNVTRYEYDVLGNVTRMDDAESRAAANQSLGLFPLPMLQMNETTTGVQPVAVGDLNGDGFEDVVGMTNVARVAIEFRGSLWLFLGQGLGRFAQPLRVDVGFNVSAVTLADVNGDGALDLVAATSSNGVDRRVSVRLNDGAGGFPNQVSTLDSNAAPMLRVADFNRDGVADLVTSAGPNGIRMLLGNGDGTFAAGQNVAIGGTPNNSQFDVGDINGDGFLDLVSSLFAGSAVSLVLGNGDGTFAAPVLLDTTTPAGAEVRAVAVTDVDGNGSNDVVAALTGRVMLVFRNDGVGGFDRADFPLTNPGDANVAAPRTMQLNDLNGDGLPDALVLHEGGVQLLRNQGGGDFSTPTTLRVGNRPSAMALGDLNQDGSLDLVSVDVQGQSVGYFLGTGDGTFQQPPTFASTQGVDRDGVPLASDDFNRDGLPDLVVGNTANVPQAATALFLGQGGTAFVAATEIPVVGATRIADVNLDGNPDVVVQRLNMVHAALGDGNGALGGLIASTLNTGVPGAQMLVIDDFNGDDLPDVVTNLTSSGLGFAAGSGDGLFGALQAAAALPNNSALRDLTAGDVNGDGIRDLAVASDRLLVLLGQGDGTFAQSFAGATSLNPQAIELADVNGDGALDLLGSVGTAQFELPRALAVFLGDGAGGFGTATLFRAASSAAVSIGTGGELIVRDFDLDGLLDAALTGPNSGSVSILRGRGDGTFAPEERFFAGFSPLALVAVDLDRDGDDDLAAANLIAEGSPADIHLLFSNAAQQRAGTGCGDGPCAQVTEWETSFSQIVRYTNGLGETILYEIDPANGNRLTQRTVVGQVDDGIEQNDAVRRLTYTPRGLLETETDPLGRITRHFHDAQGRRVRTVLAEGTPDEAEQRFEYDAAGNLIAMIDENGQRDELVYDVMNQLILTRDPLGNETLFEYDEHGNVTLVTDALGRQLRSEYDPLDRQIRVIDALGGEQRFAYDGVGNLVQQSDPLGRVMRFEYDGRNRQTRQIDAAGRSTVNRYDADDNLVAVEDPLGRVSQLVHDGRNRLTAVIDAAGFVQRTAYDLADRAVARTDERGFTTRYAFNELGQHVLETDPLGNSTRVAYDLVNNPVRHVDPLGNVTQNTFDNLNRLVRSMDALGGMESFAYDAVGNLISQTDPRGNTTTLAYDALGRLLTTTDPLGGVEINQYNAVGELTSFTDALGRTATFAFDGLGRRVEARDAAGGITRFEYDAAGNRTAIVDPLGRRTTAEYDALNRQVATTDADGGRERIRHDAVGNVIELIDPLGHATQLFHDERNLQVRVIDALGGVTQFEYDGAGNELQRTDALGRITRREYDELNRVVRVIDPLGGARSLEYDAAGNLRFTTNPLGHSTEVTYDALNRRATVEDALGGTVITVYDAAGNVVATTDPLGRTTGRTYDALNRQTEITDPLGRTGRFVYDAVGNMVQSIDPAGGVIATNYDLLNRSLGGTDPQGGQMTLQYDAAGQLISSTDALGRRTSFAYDGRGHLTRTTDPAGEVSLQRFDAAGNLVETEDAEGRVTRFEHDALRRPIRTIDGAGGVTQQQYDTVGNRVRLIDGAGNETQYHYDALNRLITKIDALGNQTTRQYDAAGNPVQETDRLGRSIVFHYDALNRGILEQWFSPGNANPVREITLQYDAAGQLIGTSDPDTTYAQTWSDAGELLTVSNAGTAGVPEVGWAYEYDASGRVERVTQTIAGQLAAAADYTRDLRGAVVRVTQAGPALSDKRVDLVYNGAGQLTQLHRFSDLGGTQAVARTTHSHDAAGRLASIEHQAGNGTPINMLTLTRDRSGQIIAANSVDGDTLYEYDQALRLTAADHSFQASEQFAYDHAGNRISDGAQVGPANQLLADSQFNYSYDAEGNLIRRDGPVTGESLVLEYDHRNRLIGVRQLDAASNVTLTADYAYDMTNRRIGKSVDPDGAGPVPAEVTRYVWDGAEIALVLDGQGNVTRQVLSGPVVDQVFAEETAGGVVWPLQDQLNTVRDLVDANGQVVNHLTYDGFGRITGESNAAIGQMFTYAGRELDMETGFYYLRNRYYDPATGRFTREDPAGLSGGDANLFRYAASDPVNRSDPNGLAPSQEDLARVTQLVSFASNPLFALGQVANNKLKEFGAEGGIVGRLDPERGEALTRNFQNIVGDSLLVGSPPGLGFLLNQFDATRDLKNNFAAGVLDALSFGVFGNVEQAVLGARNESLKQSHNSLSRGAGELTANVGLFLVPGTNVAAAAKAPGLLAKVRNVFGFFFGRSQGIVAPANFSKASVELIGLAQLGKQGEFGVDLFNQFRADPHAAGMNVWNQILFASGAFVAVKVAAGPFSKLFNKVGQNIDAAAFIADDLPPSLDNFLEAAGGGNKQVGQEAVDRILLRNAAGNGNPQQGQRALNRLHNRGVKQEIAQDVANRTGRGNPPAAVIDDAGPSFDLNTPQGLLEIEEAVFEIEFALANTLTSKVTDPAARAALANKLSGLQATPGSILQLFGEQANIKLSPEVQDALNRLHQQRQLRINQPDGLDSLRFDPDDPLNELR